MLQQKFDLCSCLPDQQLQVLVIGQTSLKKASLGYASGTFYHACCLQGVYQAACLKMFGLLEDSGWALNKEGEDDTDMPQDDENTLPDVPTLGSYSGII